MISFFYETEFKIKDSKTWERKIEYLIDEEGFEIGEINYIFCDDEYLLKINQEYLQHDYYTDVIGFQYTYESPLMGDIYISIERIKENAKKNDVSFENELARVMIHGVLHFVGFKDKTPEDTIKMREAENKYLTLFI